ncbi:MAG TPA: PAS domain-containing sensor histidine kinase [Clostridiales bacterium]|nr:MAG: hypothetical protein A2Y18_07245 [Clostridiales bacterium GWD2_32_19]HCC08191.1 PAS domain-containing sensor histidine kinase [Clostridiales bacterium]
MIYIIIYASIILQLTATLIAILLIKITKKKFYWSLLVLAMGLQVVRRGSLLYELTLGNIMASCITISEIIGLIVSILMVVSLIGIKKIFTNMRKKIAKHENANQLFLNIVGVIVVIIDKNGTVKMVNKAGCNILGYNEEEIYEKNWFDNFLPSYELNNVRRIFDEYMMSGSCESFQNRNYIICKDGSERDVLWNNTVIQDKNGNVTSMLATGQDVTERRRTREEIELYFNTAINLMGIAGTDGYFRRINPEWIRVLGWTKEELMSKPYVEYVHPDYREKAKKQLIELASGSDILGYECKFICKDGNYKWIESNLRKLYDSDIVIISAQDITLRKEIEIMNVELEKSKQMEIIKSEFFANISHELRTPLNIILSALQVEENDKDDKDDNELCNECVHQTSYHKIIKQNTYRLLKLVNNIVDLTKMDLGYFDIHKQNCNIVNIVEEITLSTSQYVEGRGITLEFDTDIEERIIACDPDKIERILLNLLSNAVKFTEPGGNIWINVHAREDKTIISVKDNGIGIEKEKINIIFEKFIQVDKSLTRRCEGSGIGLSIVKLLVEMHKGKIYVKSELGKGSEFIIELPMDLCDKINEEECRTEVINSKKQKINTEFSDI